MHHQGVVNQLVNQPSSDISPSKSSSKSSLRALDRALSPFQTVHAQMPMAMESEIKELKDQKELACKNLASIMEVRTRSTGWTSAVLLHE